MSLKGNLQSVDLANVLQMLSMNQKEGTLVLFDGDTRKSIYFSKDGVSMLSRGRRVQDSLGRILLRFGRVSPDVLKTALEKQKAEDKRLGQVLEEMGALTTADIDDAVRTQIEEEIYNLFIWKEASFEFIEGPPPPALENVPTRVTFNVNSLIMEAQRRADEWNYIRGLVPSLDEIYKPGEKMAEAVVTDEVFHLPFAGSILEQLQVGRRNVNELIEESHAAKFEACKILAILLEQGAVEPVSIGDLQNFAQEATSRGEHAQAAKFLSRIVDLGGATPSVNMSLGYALEALDEPERAAIYLKAAAESYVESMEPAHAFTAYQRVARALPTDLPAITQVVEIACANAEILAANRHEVIEAGRTLAQCLRELGRLPAAVQILNRLAQTSPGDLPLRNMLVQAYSDGGMANEAMSELESMATHCADLKNYDEAIRCLRRVIAIDRNRAGVLKRIENLTRARDSGTRMVLRIAAFTTVIAAVGAAGYGLIFFRDKGREKEAAIDAKVSAALDPLRKEFEDAEKEAKALLSRLDGFKSVADMAELEKDFAALKAAMATLERTTVETGKRALALQLEHEDVLRSTFGQERTAKLQSRLGTVRTDRGIVIGRIQQWCQDEFTAVSAEALRYPLKAIPKVERVVRLLVASESPLDGIAGGKTARMDESLKTLRGYEKQVAERQAEANALYDADKFREGHERLAEHLGTYFTVVEFAERYEFRARVTTVPAGATVSVLDASGSPVGEPRKSPLEVRYTAARGLALRTTAPGFQPADTKIPALDANFDADALRTKLPAELRIVLTKVPVWSAQLGPGGVEAPPVPLPDGSSFVAADRNGGVHLIAVADGRITASFETKSASGFRAAPLVTADAVFLGTLDGMIVALDLPGLTERWRKTPAEGPGPVAGDPVLAGGAVVFAGRSGQVMAFDPASGEVKWTAKLDSGTDLPLLFARAWVVATCEDGRARTLGGEGVDPVVVLPSARPLSGYPRPRSRPLAVGDRVLFGLEGAGKEFSLVELPVPGAASPHLGYKWGASLPGAEVSGACIDGDDVYLLFGSGIVWKVSSRFGPRPGDVQGKILPEKTRALGSPAAKGGTVFVAFDRGVLAVRPGAAEFAEVWNWSTGADGPPLSTSPVLLGNLVVVGTRDGKLHALLQE
jgi:outer membrane protein assembly factor BamB/tetratricopeptide (TPR) repeat protein